jgi:hypothetical protein
LISSHQGLRIGRIEGMHEQDPALLRSTSMATVPGVSETTLASSVATKGSRSSSGTSTKAGDRR